jgi:hypothetical protein
MQLIQCSVLFWLLNCDTLSNSAEDHYDGLA